MTGNFYQPVPKWRITEVFPQKDVPAIEWEQVDLYEGDSWDRVMSVLSDNIRYREDGERKMFYIDYRGDREHIIDIC